MAIEGIHLDRLEIMDIRTMVKPPAVVMAALTATALLLGHWQEKTLVWRDLKILLLGTKSRHYITEVTSALDPESVTLEVALGARSLLEGYTEMHLYEKITSGKTFWRWITAVIEAVLARFSEEEISRTKPRIKENVDS